MVFMPGRRIGDTLSASVRSLRRPAIVVGVLGSVMTLSGCSEPVPERVYVESFTDAHGRACTFVYTTEPGSDADPGADTDISQIDCEYPPEGREPGRSGSVEINVGIPAGPGPSSSPSAP
ncbi:hypothetical protein [Myceligenerans pegani]|uniref:Secreted protein n=1 Tax=Myceligenerans pegani TaxID=2776917 RepID=A0ABR9N4T1_9MICO|nr:hypothetical protein [Myceligenerans sp. TRM 65318]MBE1878350.1 hypothetical protein [Myceligenerans sp. TRM 65318]MBE3020621.1 hypothetical protein [Myceligenerans sp. TRM 65318]